MGRYAEEIPACAGMTWEGAGMTWEGAGMTGATRGNDVGGCGHDGDTGGMTSRSGRAVTMAWGDSRLRGNDVGGAGM